MDITEDIVGDAVVLDVRGRLYGIEAGSLLERTADRLGRAGWRNIIVNLEGVSTIDAGGLGALLAACGAVVRYDIRLRFVHVTEWVSRLIVLSGLADILLPGVVVPELGQIGGMRERTSQAHGVTPADAKRLPRVAVHFFNGAMAMP